MKNLRQFGLTLCTLLLLGSVLTGCGNKGDLVRPGAPPAAAEKQSTEE